MIANRSVPSSTVIPELPYDDVPAASEWICRAFGFKERLRIGDHRAQLVFGEGAVILTSRGAKGYGAVLVRVPDADRHHEQAKRSGAKILQSPADHPYGERQYSAEDSGGHVWTFSQSIADVDPAHGVAPFDSLPSLRDVPSASAAQMAEADRIASEELGIPLESLMENASHQIAVAVRLFLGGVAGKRIVAFAGSGNNGGDALGALRHLSGWGAKVGVVLSGPAERLRPLARRQHDVLAGLGVQHDAAVDDADLIIDGLLGYSASGPPRDSVADLIRAANASRLPILAVDLPSGLHPDSGEPLGVTIRAALTVTLALPKRGLVATRSRALIGDLLLADIGIPPQVFDRLTLETRGLFESGDLVRIIP